MTETQQREDEILFLVYQFYSDIEKAEKAKNLVGQTVAALRLIQELMKIKVKA